MNDIIGELMDNKLFLLTINNTIIKVSPCKQIDLCCLPIIMLTIFEYIDKFIIIEIKNEELMIFYEKLIMEILEYYDAMSEEDYDEFIYSIKGILQLLLYKNYINIPKNNNKKVFNLFINKLFCCCKNKIKIE